MAGRHITRTPEQLEALIAGLGERGLKGPVRRLARAYNVRFEDVLMGYSNPRVVVARDACAHLILGKGFSTVEAGRLLGMHHTSIIAARNRYEKRDMGRLLS